MSASFYSDLPIFRDFRGVADGNNYHDVPDDWLVVVSDIKGSTKAIESGRYKEVNILGASSIIAVLNYVQNVEIPFVFGETGHHSSFRNSVGNLWKKLWTVPEG